MERAFFSPLFKSHMCSFVPPHHRRFTYPKKTLTEFPIKKPEFYDCLNAVEKRNSSVLDPYTKMFPFVLDTGVKWILALASGVIRH